MITWSAGIWQRVLRAGALGVTGKAALSLDPELLATALAKGHKASGLTTMADMNTKCFERVKRTALPLVQSPQGGSDTYVGRDTGEYLCMAQQ